MVARTVCHVCLAVSVLAGCGAADRPGTSPPPAPVDGAVDPRPASTVSTPAAGDGVGRGGTVTATTVAYVTDGDTIGARAGGSIVRVRLLGIDAPETKDPDLAPQCWGAQATAAARRLLPRDTAVTLVTDPTQDRFDRYGRLLAYVFRRGERTPVNEALVRAGHARVYVYRRSRPFRRVAAFRAAEVAARTERRGLWAACRPASR